MLVLHRAVGESIVIEDVRATLVRTSSMDCELAFRKLGGGRTTIGIFPRDEFVATCYDVRIVFLGEFRSRARLGIEGARELNVAREEARE